MKTPTTKRIFPAGTSFGSELEETIRKVTKAFEAAVPRVMDENAQSPESHDALHGAIYREVSAAVDKIVLAYMQKKVASDHKWRYSLSVCTVKENAYIVFDEYLTELFQGFFEERYEEGMTAQDLLAKYVTGEKFSEPGYRYTCRLREICESVASNGRLKEMMDSLRSKAQ